MNRSPLLLKVLADRSYRKMIRFEAARRIRTADRVDYAATVRFSEWGAIHAPAVTRLNPGFAARLRVLLRLPAKLWLGGMLEAIPSVKGHLYRPARCQME